MTLTADRSSPAAVEPTALPAGLKGAVVGRRMEVWQAYQDHKVTQTAPCPFCAEVEAADEVIAVHGSMLVVLNKFPYAAWDGMHVLDHLMVVPARHVLGKAEFTDAEAADWWAVACDYEARGYSVYTRSPGNASRSVAHLHTHLILAEGWFTG